MRKSKQMLDLQSFSDKYSVRRLAESDAETVFALCSKNALYYEYCPPFVTRESVIDDMNALPPGKTFDDKYYAGYFDGDKLIAVLDLIVGYPNDKIAFVGFFMTEITVQGRGVGTEIIDSLCRYLCSVGFDSVRLAWVKGNPQAEHFWLKNCCLPRKMQKSDTQNTKFLKI
ncbi:MAG: GNAT family N-acetyltransferase [Ruminiclostridium sp.]